ncbi:O-linked N-acetylglucosamine transferase, SPINDLY family protein [Azospirillum rugosum]|uniref:protein O-GlcNAc transferase n=1 Tax=Azospirillum rugosum TaxID=416170 RepID=A0ABS4SWS2_9PROT|nr:glycosyltransferase family 41 protein [Azospirillum rugosum]MBP2295840.1 putative O-linked N-acetylglucosamine transferase (SPINDLY family) [Azospirillum rugosum]MDQ0529049.1 putative O-linked N-acetylglucosamine transferase (SPINDLY family) [Azospirillum rugosum]
MTDPDRPDPAAPGAQTPAVASATLLADGLAHHEAGRLAEAETAYRRLLDQDPGNSDGWNLLGVVRAQQGDARACVRCIRSALAIREAPEYLYNLGTALRDLGRLDEAVAAYERVVRLAPDRADAHMAVGALHQLRRQPIEAIAAYRRAIAIRPDSAEAHSSLGMVLQEVGQREEAIAAFSAAILHKPSHAEGHSNLGFALQGLGRLSESAAAFAVALAFRPEFPEAWSNLGNTFKEMGLLDRAVAAYRTALAQRPHFPEAAGNLAMTQHYASECGNADFLATARESVARLGLATGVTAPPRAFPNAEDPDRPLRVGYVSGDFNSHPVGYFLESVLAAHDRAAVTIHCYANNVRRDALTDRLRARADVWRDIAGLDDDTVEGMVRGDGIDLLVDLSGHTAGNRLPLFARKPAPVQVSWLGYFGTTGLPAMDHIIADRHVVSPGEERFFTETVWRLPGSYLCFTPPSDRVPVTPPPMLGTGVVTLGCFQNRAKITSATVALWAGVLAAMPQARLLVKARQMGDAGVRQALRDRFAAHGIAANRVRMEGESPRADYLAGHGRIDIAVDTTPFGGGTTTAECLWMGVPLVTLRGDRWAGRIGESLLHTLGLADRLVADSPADYVAKVAALAGDPAALADLRAGLRGRLEQSPLCDGPGFARGLEAAYRAMWQGWCRKR